MSHAGIARTLAPLTLAGLAGCAGYDEPILDPDGVCERQWARSIPLGDDAWSELGGNAAEHGTTTLVAWQQEEVKYTLGSSEKRNPVVMMALLDNETGEMLVEPQQLHGGRSNAIRVVATPNGYLVLAFGDETVRATPVAEDGEILDGTRHSVPVATFDEPVLVDEQGVLMFNFGPVLTRLTHDGRPLSTAVVPALPPESFCTTVVALDDGRLAAWCLRKDRETAPLYVKLDGDGANAVVVEMEAFPRRPALLARMGERVVLAQQVDADATMVTVLDDEGGIVSEPTRVGTAPGGYELLGSTVCVGTCKGLDIGAVGNRAVLGYESFPVDAEAAPMVSFVNLALADDAIVATPILDVEAHAYDVTPTGPGVLTTWLETPGVVVWPWDLPNQNLIVKHDCTR